MLSLHRSKLTIPAMLRARATPAVPAADGESAPSRAVLPGVVAAAAVAGSVAALLTSAFALVIAYLETSGAPVTQDVGPLNGYGIAVVAAWSVTWCALYLRWRGRQLPWAPVRVLTTISVLVAVICLVFAFYRTAPMT
jgi:hypothetical protein